MALISVTIHEPYLVSEACEQAWRRIYIHEQAVG